MFEPDEGTLHADGFEDACVGYGRQFNRILAIYDYDKCIKILMEWEDMTEEQAVKFFEFNVVGAWVGEYTPVFVTLRKE
jgi:hypothetical protein